MKLNVNNKEIISFEATTNECIKLHELLGKYIESLGPYEASGLQMTARVLRNQIGKLLKLETPLLKIKY